MTEMKNLVDGGWVPDDIDTGTMYPINPPKPSKMKLVSIILSCSVLVSALFSLYVKTNSGIINTAAIANKEGFKTFEYGYEQFFFGLLVLILAFLLAIGVVTGIANYEEFYKEIYSSLIELGVKFIVVMILAVLPLIMGAALSSTSTMNRWSKSEYGVSIDKPYFANWEDDQVIALDGGTMKATVKDVNGRFLLYDETGTKELPRK